MPHRNDTANANVAMVPEIMLMVESSIMGVRVELKPNPKLRVSGNGFHTTKFSIHCQPMPDGRFHIYYEAMSMVVKNGEQEFSPMVVFEEYNEGKSASDVAQAVFGLFMKVAFMYGEQLAVNILAEARAENDGALPEYDRLREILAAKRRALM